MQLFKINLKTASYSAIFIVACFIIYTLQRQSYSGSFLVAPHAVSMKIHETYGIFAQNIGVMAEKYLMLLDLKKKIWAIQEENQQLKAELQVLNEIKMENHRLTQLHEIKSQLVEFERVSGRITGRDLFSDHFSLYLDKGEKDSVSNLSGVITYDGVIGYTIDVQETSSRILLLTDRLMSIDAMVQRTRSRGIVSGYGQNLSVLKFLDRPQDLSVGDLVVTSTDQKMFPAGFPIGQITSVHIHSSGVGHYAIIRPIVDNKKISEALVLKIKK